MLAMWWCLLFFLIFPSVGWSFDRIVSLSPQITESVFLLDAGDRLVAVTDMCTRPGGLSEKEKVGKPLAPDVERIVALNPDLVLASREGNPPWIVERLKRMGVRVRYFPRPHNFQELCDNFIVLGRELKRQEVARAIVDYVHRQLRSGDSSSPKRLMWQVGADPLVVASASSFVNDMIVFAGGMNVIETSLPYPRLNREEVLAKKPDFIVLMDMGYNVDVEKERWRRRLPGTRFIVMDSYITGSPTPVTFAVAVQKLRDALRNAR